MTLKKSILLFLAASFAWTHASADDLKQIPPPTAPFVAPVPENADWTVTVQNPPEQPAPPPAPGAPPRVDRRISEIHSTKFGKFKRELITYVNGTVDEHWYIGMLYLWTPPNQEVSIYNLGNATMNPDGSNATASPGPSGSSAGYAGVGWVGLKTYDKVVIYENVPCYHYQDTAQGTEAWINSQTRLPVANKTADLLYRFKFNAPPTEPLTLPPTYQKAWDRMQVILKFQG